MLITAGERKAMALLCMALHDIGVPADSFTGSQAGFITDTDHTNAKILEVAARPPAGGARRRAGARGRRRPGGVDRPRRHLPRPGRLRHHRRGAGPGPRRRRLRALHRRVRRLHRRPAGRARAPGGCDRISFDEMLEMCAAGCPKPAMRSVEFARNHGVRLHVRSAFTWEPGTWITEEDPAMEQAIVSAVVSDTLRGQGHRHRRARPARHRRPAVPGPGRADDQRRHDRAERVGGRARPTSPSPSPTPTWRRPQT